MSDAVQPAPRPKTSGRGGDWFGLVAAAASIIGFGGACFIAGAATIQAGGGIARPLAEGLNGARAWLGGPPAPTTSVDRPPPGLSVCKEPAFDGLTLVATGDRAEAHLYDRAGKVAHRWRMPARVPGLKASDKIGWERCHAYPNGDLLALCTPAGDTPYGLGVVKLDKDSNLLWHRKGNFHHDFDVGEDGRVYLFEMEIVAAGHPGAALVPDRSQDERLVVLSANGEVERSCSLLQAFLGTPYLETFLSVNASDTPPALGLPHPPGGPHPQPTHPHPPMPGPAPPVPHHSSASLDTFHANSVRVLPRSLAGKFPLFKAGQLLLSLRTPSLLVVLDLEKQAVVWAARGPWRHQHDAQFLDNGRILLFDNLGGTSGSRVLEYDPATHAIPWRSTRTSEAAFRAHFRGRCQRLPNGNTRITDPTERIFEVAGDEVVWQLGFGRGEGGSAPCVTSSIVYPRDGLPFLK